MGEPRPIPQEMQSSLALWKRKAYAWESLHLTLGIAALILMPLTHVMSQQHDLEWSKSPLLHMGCAADMVFVALVTFLHPRTHARVYWSAYYRLHLAILHFLGHTRASEEKLWNARIEAERRIARAEEEDHLEGPLPSVLDGTPAIGGRHRIHPDIAPGNGDAVAHRTDGAA